MKALLITLCLFLPFEAALAKDLVSISNERILDIALKHLLNQKPSLKQNDLEAKLIHVTTHPKDTDNFYLNVSVEFIYLPSKEHRCENVTLSPDLAAVISENERAELSQKCGYHFLGYSVNFNASQQNGQAEVRETSFGGL